MACEECRDLAAHEFQTAADMVHAVQTAAAELDRGVLRRVQVEELTAAERDALYSVFEADATGGSIRYRFECTVCGDRFELWADMATGRGAWTRA